MKIRKLNLAIIASTLLIFTACEKSTILTEGSVEGKYIGTLTSDYGTKSAEALSDGDATADVVMTGDGLIEVHCYGSELDTTFMLNYYHNNDSVNVCATGEAFEHMYGHSMQSSNMMSQGGMMNGSNGGNAEWMNHMSDNHDAGDEHFGGFDMANGTFGYTIETELGQYRFQGVKQ
jgi:hypothetical protein